ncbi:hypothetical protein NPIL_594361 [Nephila pilipes]|uniref:Uncharacterized protein n=1 Tax=Nephila pilipes TaxID=299642 RepID=A0A8X6U2V4_NEPPI|nr:hypothetical protein NPIL_594361 [Nephila pilipes]
MAHMDWIVLRNVTVIGIMLTVMNMLLDNAIVTRDGIRCDSQCDQGQCGPECGNICDCKTNSSCDIINGLCFCERGWTGKNCGQICSAGYFGFTGLSCSETCPSDHYELRCKSLRKCKNYGQCNPATEECQCPLEWKGDVCSMPCPNGTFSLLCKENCSCLNGGYCRRNDGVCRCSPGWMSHQCTQVCFEGYYGDHCMQQHQCKNENYICNSISGCICKYAYGGEKCEIRLMGQSVKKMDDDNSSTNAGVIKVLQQRDMEEMDEIQIIDVVVRGQQNVVNVPVQGQQNVVNVPVQGQQNVVNVPVQGQRNVVNVPVQGQRNVVNVPVQGQRNVVYVPVQLQRNVVYVPVQGQRNVYNVLVQGQRNVNNVLVQGQIPGNNRDLQPRENPVVLRYETRFPPGYINVTRSDVKRVEPENQASNDAASNLVRCNKWLNDIIIDYYIEYIYNNKLTARQRSKTYILNSYFYPSLCQGISREERNRDDDAFEVIRNWTMGVNLLEKEYIIMPVNANSHWFLVIACFPCNVPDFDFDDEPMPKECKKAKRKEVDIQMTTRLRNRVLHNHKTRSSVILSRKSSTSTERARAKVINKRPCICVFDSMYDRERGEDAGYLLRNYLLTMHYVQNGYNKDFLKMTVHVMNSPQQRNFDDCGLYLLKNVELFFKNASLFNKRIPDVGTWFGPLEAYETRREIYHSICS